MSAEVRADLTSELLLDLFDDEFLNDCYGILSSLPDEPGAALSADAKEGRLTAAAVRDGMARLQAALDLRLRESSDPEWSAFVQMCMLHPLWGLLKQDPFTAHANWAKPDGYPNDARLLEFLGGVTGRPTPPAGTSELGQLIFEYTTQMGVCCGIRNWPRTVAKAMDELAAEFPSPEILSLMPGPLREAQLSVAWREGRIGRWLVIDSSAQDLRAIRQSEITGRVETMAGTVGQLLSGNMQLGPFHGIYVTGVYDGLERPNAKRLTRTLFDRLSPGGQLVIANFLPDTRERGYLESYMQWRLVYRSPDQMLELASAIDEGQRYVSFVREEGLPLHAPPNLVILRITRR